jgi:hypothetical protein
MIVDYFMPSGFPDHWEFFIGILYRVILFYFLFFLQILSQNIYAAQGSMPTLIPHINYIREKKQYKPHGIISHNACGINI